jgi:hypothetical protein
MQGSVLFVKNAADDLELLEIALERCLLDSLSSLLVSLTKDGSQELNNVCWSGI